MTWVTQKPSEHLHAAVPAQNMLMGTGKLTAQIAPDGVGSGKAVAVPRAVLQKSGTRGVTPPRTPGAACRDVSLPEHGAFPRLLDPSPWLAGILQPVPAFCGSRSLAAATELSLALPAGLRHRQRTLRGAKSGGRS